MVKFGHTSRQRGKTRKRSKRKGDVAKIQKMQKMSKKRQKEGLQIKLRKRGVVGVFRNSKITL